MKKSVMLLISLFSLIAVCLVAFFGVFASNIVVTNYIQKINIKDMNGNEIPEVGGVKTLQINFVEDMYDIETDQSYMNYFLTVSLNEGLEEPSNPSVLYSVPENGYVTLNGENAARNGALLIKERTSNPSIIITTISCYPNDGGSAKEDVVRLVIRCGDLISYEGE